MSNRRPAKQVKLFEDINKCHVHDRARTLKNAINWIGVRGCLSTARTHIMIGMQAENNSVDASQEELRSNFLSAMRLVPSPVAIIAVAHNGQRRGLAATAWTSLSADPPTILACVNQTASAHEILRKAGAFSLNLLNHADAEIVAIFSAQRELDGNSRFQSDRWRIGSSGLPILSGSVMSLECDIVEMRKHHTHSVMIGAVRHISINPDTSSLLYIDGGFARVKIGF